MTCNLLSSLSYGQEVDSYKKVLTRHSKLGHISESEIAHQQTNMKKSLVQQETIKIATRSLASIYKINREKSRLKIEKVKNE